MSVTTTGMVRKDVFDVNEAEVAPSNFVCTIQDNTEMLGNRGGEFVKTSFSVNKCGRGTCGFSTVSNVLSKNSAGDKNHISHGFVASRATVTGEADDKGHWCLCRENLKSEKAGRMLISFSGIHDKYRPCNPATCFDEYTRYVEKYVLMDIPGKTQLSKRETAGVDGWSHKCCDSNADSNCPKDLGISIVPLRKLVKQLNEHDDAALRDPQMLKLLKTLKQVNLDESEFYGAEDTGGENDPTGSLSSPDPQVSPGTVPEGKIPATVMTPAVADHQHHQAHQAVTPKQRRDIKPTQPTDSQDSRVPTKEKLADTLAVIRKQEKHAKMVEQKEALEKEALEKAEAAAAEAAEAKTQVSPAGDTSGQQVVRTVGDTEQEAASPARPDVDEVAFPRIPTKAELDATLTVAAETPTSAHGDRVVPTKEELADALASLRKLANTAPSVPAASTGPVMNSPVELPQDPVEAGEKAAPAVDDASDDAAFDPATRSANFAISEWQYRWMEPFCRTESDRTLMSWELACMMVYDDRVHGAVPTNPEDCGLPEKPPVLLVVAPMHLVDEKWVPGDLPDCTIENGDCCSINPDGTTAPKCVPDPHGQCAKYNSENKYEHHAKASATTTDELRDANNQMEQMSADKKTVKSTWASRMAASWEEFKTSAHAKMDSMTH